MQISQPIFQLFLKLNIPVHNLLFELCTGLFLYPMCLQLRFKMRAHFVSSVLFICPKNQFSILKF